ncbi:MAG: prenyltransferase [Pseudomonadota bacterium]
MLACEPTREAFEARPLLKYILATRPPFLLAALIAAVIGLATAVYAGASFHPWLAAITLIGAVTVHAGINVFNDYYDALNGTDAINMERLYPFTGGSRFIQNGVLDARETRDFALLLFGLTALIGIGLTVWTGLGLVWVGLAGLLIGWAYSAPPLALNSRGLGELSVALGFGLLMPLGADMVQRHAFDPLPMLAGLPYALLVANLLYINQFPDRLADAAAGKRHWVVRLGPDKARWGYILMALAAYAILILEWAWGALPDWALLGLLPIPLSIFASLALLRHAASPDRLGTAIRMTIAAALSHGALLSLGLALAA